MTDATDHEARERDWERVKETLDEAQKRPEGVRTAFVEESLADAPGLIAEVLSLLAAGGSPAPVLRALDDAVEGAGADPAATGPSHLDPLGPSSMVGPYRLEELVGEGGMGDVWRAEQLRPIRRRVAVKIVRLGMDTKKVVRRFEHERQALAVMDHPNIARVYDAGATPTGRPFFVMELVEGRPIGDFADAERLTTRARLELFLEVCRAVQHAHQKGVIHRDLKPSNLLVRHQEGRASVKVIDFGIAKALGSSLVDESVHTRTDQVLGTPDYMSPEQADPQSRDVDTRADIYSLGVVLYELLTGSRPYRIQGRLDFALAYRLRELETAPPSAHVTRSGTQVTLAHHRSTTVAGLRRELSGDLDWIVMKAIEKDRGRRYATVNELAQDLERYLRSEPVLARPPSALYRASRFVRRHRAGVAAASVALVAILGGGTVAGFGWARATEEARVATSRQLAAASALQLDRDPELGLLLALRAAESSPTRESEDALDRALDSRILATIVHSDAVMDGDLSADGRRVAVATRDGRLSVVDLDSESTHLTVETTAGRVAFAPDGRRVATGHGSGEVRIWNAGNGALLAEMAGHTGGTWSLAFDPTGRRIASGGGDGTVRVWDGETGEALLAIDAGPEEVRSVAFDPTGERIASGGEDMVVRIWDASTGERLFEIPPPPGTRPDSPNQLATLIQLRFDAAGERLASAGTNGLHVWDASTGERRWGRGTPSFYDVAFGPDGTSIAAAGYDRVVRVFEAGVGAELLTVEGHTDFPHSVAFTPDQDRIVTTSMDGTTRVWSARAGAQRRTLGGHEAPARRLEYGPDGRTLATASFDRTAIVHELPDGGPRPALPHAAVVTDVAYSPDGRRVATTAADGSVTLWDAATGAVVANREGEGPAMTIAFSPDGALVAGGQAGTTVWAVEDDELSVRWEAEDRRSYAAAFADAGRLLVISTGSEALVLDAATGDSVGALVAHRRRIESVAVSPDGLVVGTASLDGTGRLWDVRTGRELRSLRGHRERLYGIAFSPDGRRVATAGGEGVAKVWDMATGNEIATMDGSRGIVFDVAFRPDGEELALATEPGRVQLFPHGLEALVAAAEARVDRELTDEECRRFLPARECR